MAIAAQTSLIANLRVQRRVLSALLLRELLTRYGRHNLGFLWLFVEPMLFTLGVTALWGPDAGGLAGVVSIMAASMVGYQLLRGCPGRR